MNDRQGYLYGGRDNRAQLGMSRFRIAASFL